jgi:DNA-binding NarL/FixJ family response regulator
VDDDDAWAKHFAASLQSMGVKLTRVADVKKLPAADLYLIDEHCASVSADDALAALSKGKLFAKSIILTTAINPERVADFLNAGVRDVQLKPYTNEEMAELVS